MKEVGRRQGQGWRDSTIDHITLSKTYGFIENWQNPEES
jgi:hypothetical protein